MSSFRTVFSRLGLPFFFLLVSTPAFSADDGIETLKKALAKNQPNIEVSQTNKSPIAGLYELIVGDQIVYLDKNAEW